MREIRKQRDLFLEKLHGAEEEEDRLELIAKCVKKYKKKDKGVNQKGKEEDYYFIKKAKTG